MTLRPRTPPRAGSREHRKLEALVREAARANSPELPPELPPEPMPEPAPIRRANYVAAPHYFLLSQACRIVNDAFQHDGFGCYLVGSALRTKEYRDVDVRLILEDEAYDKLFGAGSVNGPQYNPLWSLLCASISQHLERASGLPIDFQIQRQTEANAAHSRANGHDRQALGMFHNLKPHEPYPGGG